MWAVESVGLCLFRECEALCVFGGTGWCVSVFVAFRVVVGMSGARGEKRTLSVCVSSRNWIGLNIF